MTKPLICIAFLLSATCCAFQVAPIRTVTTTRALVPHRRLSSQRGNQFVSQNTHLLSALRLSLEDDSGDAIVETPQIELLAEEPELSRNSNTLRANFASKVKQALNTNQPVATFFLSLSIFLLPFFLLSSFPESACAVQSGGRMGGSFGGGSRQSSSRTYSAPSSNRGYSSRGYGGRGYSSGRYYSRPNVVVSPGISPFYSPFYSPFSPFYARPSGVVVSTGPSFGGLFFFAGFFVIAALVLSNIGSAASDTFSNTLAGSNDQSVLGSGISVAEISVAMEVPDRDSPNSILSALGRLSRTARTDSRVGLQNLTSQVAIELLRRKSSIVAASTIGHHYRDENKAQREYNNLTIRERGKFQRETVSKYGGVDYSDPALRSTGEYSAKATVAVVTIAILIDGDSTSRQLSSRVNSIGDVEDALSRIAADAKAESCLRGAEILWTPEERDDTLTMKEVFADYSSLRSI